MKTKLSGILTLFLAFTVQMAFAQTNTVTGTVTSEDGLPLPGVNIRVEGTDLGTQTDFNGNYSIEVDQGETLIFKYVGYTTNKVTVGASNTIDVVLKKSAEELQEVVITKYRNTTKEKSAAAISTITAENIENRPNASVVSSLQGQVAGLNIGTNIGQPGANSTIILRGVGSINGNVEPLLIVNGVPVDEDNLATINPNNIASVSVLKDAAATSIYGNRGANGVIVINTKTGSYGQQLTFNYDALYGISVLPPLGIDLMTSRQLLTFQRDNQIENSRGFGLSDAKIDAIADQTNTYWPDVFFAARPTNSQNLSITSGSKNTSNYTSIGYFNQKGTFIASGLKRFTFRNNFRGRSDNKKFHYNANVKLGFSKKKYSGRSGGNATYFNPFINATGGLPYISPYDPDGSLTHTGGFSDEWALDPNYAPIVLLNSIYYNTNREEEFKATASMSADWDFAEHFNISGFAGIDYSTVRYLNVLHPKSFLGPYQTDLQRRTQYGGVEQNNWSRDARFTSNLNLTYKNTFNDVHTLEVNLYTEYLKSHYDGFGFTQQGLNPKTLGSGAAYIAGTTTVPYSEAARPYIPTVSRSNFNTGLFSYFATADYGYKDRFGFYASIRRDATFRFVDEQAWGTFWSVAGRWNIDEESWMQDSDFNSLKLRVSYGTVGNQRITGDYYGGLQLYTSTFSTGVGYNNSTAFALTNLGNPSLHWEETAQFNIGIDFALWRSKLQGSIDFYNKKTTDLLQDKQISPITSQRTVNANIGSLKNTGIEADVKYTIIDNEDWFLSVNANGSYNKNEVIELSGENEQGIIPTQGNTSLGEGHPIGSYYVVDYVGVNPANGNPLFRDAQGNLTETLDVDNDRVYSDRQVYPVFQGGFGATVSYKNFALSNQWVYFGEIYRANGNLADLENNSSGAIAGSNRATSLFNSWQNPGDITTMPKINGPYGFADYINNTDRYLQDASYLRLRNVTLSYKLDDKTLENLPFTAVKIYVQGENLITFSKWQGFDAQSDFRSYSVWRYPTPKIYSIGLNVKF